MTRSRTIVASLLAVPASVLVLGLAFALGACGPAGGGGDDDDDDDGGACSAGQTQCAGSQFQTCVDGQFTTTESCTGTCDPDRGCASCTPGMDTCNGNDVVACNPDGSLGAIIQSCGEGAECDSGTCVRTCSADGVDLIYVADLNFRLLSFDPRLVGTGDPFHVIGPLSCSAGTATPFSMAVDRDAQAWVLYSDGEIFEVSTQNAACASTTFVPNQSAGGRSWNVFAMGFVTDMTGGDTEKLWIGGGNTDVQMPGDLGYLAPPTSFDIQRVGPMITTSEYNPELTGLGDATLWGFYPGISHAFVQQIDKTTGGGLGPERTIPGGLGASVAAWAFAQWGGKFYLFVTTTDGLTQNSSVRTIDRTTGQYQIVAQNLPYIIVGAGVSTCAPITIGRRLPWEALPANRLPLDGASWR
ncbi:MAG TPA: hypothetical protein VHE35_11855 [Kofleriaceae bacterium]|nr:hypothetical protein [Kofleriaceae bacterium]